MENKTLHISLEEQLYPIWQDFCSEQQFSLDKRLQGVFAAYLEDFFLYLPSTGSYAKTQQLIVDNNVFADMDNRFYINQALIAISGRKDIYSQDNFIGY